MLKFSLPLALLTAALSLGLSPWASYKAMEFRKKMESRDDITTVSPGTFRENRDGSQVFFVETYNPLSGLIREVFGHSVRRSKLNTVVASRAYQVTHENLDVFLVMEDGRRYEGDPKSTEYRVLEFQRQAQRIRAREAVLSQPTSAERSTWELLQLRTPILLGELWWRLSLPLALILLTLVAVPLSHHNPRVGQAYNLVIALLLFAIYTNLLNVSQAAVATGKLHPWVGMAPVHAVLFSIALILYRYRTGRLRTPWRRKA